MPRNIADRLENLRVRRNGTDRLTRLTEDAANEVLRKSLSQEPWQRRAGNQPYTRYALGAMQAVDSDYTRISMEEAERVAKQLIDGLPISVTTRVQGSVPLNVHVRGVSDVDQLVLRTDFYTYDTTGQRARSGLYRTPTPLNSLTALSGLRTESEELLKRRFWGATVDCNKGKCIALSGGSFRRPVDVVPSHWHDNVEYQLSNQEYDRGVTIYDKNSRETVPNRPFTHIKRVHDRDVEYLGGVKKAIRLVKNVKNDAENSSTASKLPSFDIAALLYHAESTALKAGYINELYILGEARRFFDWCYTNKDLAGRLMTPDGLRPVLNSQDKWTGLTAISSELDDLARQVAHEQGALGPSALWSDIYRSLGSARIPAAA